MAGRGRRTRKRNRMRSEGDGSAKEKTPAVIYARLSRADEYSGKDSMKNQLMMLRSAAEQIEDIELCGEFQDDGYSGLSFDRPAFEAMMDGIYKGKYKCVIVKDLSRLGRNYLETSDLLEREFPLLGCRFISVSDRIDTKYSQADTILTGLKNIMNQKYAEDISKKIRTAIRPKIENGEFLGGPAPYGYKRDPENRGRLLIDEPAAEVVRRIFQMKLDEMNDGEAARRLTKEHILNPSEYFRWKKTGEEPEPYKGWNARQIRAISVNPVYQGHVIHGKFRDKKFPGEKDMRTKKEDWIICENVNPPVISQEVFDRVQEIRPHLKGKVKP